MYFHGKFGESKLIRFIKGTKRWVFMFKGVFAGVFQAFSLGIGAGSFARDVVPGFDMLAFQAK